MHVKKVKIKNYRNFDEATITLSNFNVFIGKNGSGKSNFLKGIRNAITTFDGSFQEFNAINDANVLSDSDFYAHVVMSEEEKRKIIARLGREDERKVLSMIDKFDFEVETLYVSGKIRKIIIKLIVPNEKLPTMGNGQESITPSYLPLNDFISIIDAFFLSETREIPSSITPTTNRTAANFDVLNALVEMKLNQREKYDSIMEKARVIAPEVKSLEVSLSQGHASVTLSIMDVNKMIPVKSMSKGFRELFIILIVLEFAPRGSLVTIEEPEVHLHYSSIMKLREIMLNTVKEKNVQIILTTHSYKFLTDLFPETDDTIKFIEFQKRENSSYSDVREIKTDKEVSELINSMKS